MCEIYFLSLLIYLSTLSIMSDIGSKIVEKVNAAADQAKETLTGASKPTTEQKAKGTVNKAVGSVKETIGGASNDTTTQLDGTKDKMKGNMQQI